MKSSSGIMCEHKYIHLDTDKYQQNVGFQNKYLRIDRFYCEKCTDIKIVKKEGYARYFTELEWY